MVKPTICRGPPFGSLSLARTASTVVVSATTSKVSATAMGALFPVTTSTVTVAVAVAPCASRTV